MQLESSERDGRCAFSMSDSASTASSPARSLRNKAAHGVMWGVALAIVSRLVGVLQQFALVWLLQKSDFGLMGLAYTVTAFVNLLANPGIDAVLIQRHRRFHLWATPAFWMGMTTGAIGMVATIAVAPLAAAAYGRPELTGLLWVMSAAMPLQTLQIVPKAKLQSDLLFKRSIQLSFLGNILTAATTICFAAAGLGPYSFVVPLPLTATFLAIAYWKAARPRIRKTPQFKRWKHLLGDSVTLAGTRIMLNVVGQGDYMVLGLSRFPTSLIGVYVFAFGIAIQPFRLIAGSVDAVLLPSLSQKGFNAAQQTRAVLRATRLLAFFIVPVCTLQILLAEPLFRLVVPERWLAAVVPLQILSIAVMVSAPYWPALSLMMAQRRFKELLRVATINGVTFFSTVGLAVLIHRSIESAAVGVTLWNAASSPWAFRVAAGATQGRFIYIKEIYRPFVAGLVAAVPAYAVIYMLAGPYWGDLAACVAGTCLFSVVFLLLMRAYALNDFRDFVFQVSPLLQKVGFPLPASETAISEGERLAP